MNIDVKKNALVALGKFLKQFTSTSAEEGCGFYPNEELYTEFTTLIKSSVHYNGWFTEEQVLFAVDSWAKALTEEYITHWLSSYDCAKEPLKRVGLILAGNIPLVGFHDFLSVILSGNIAYIKLSSNDQKLLPFLAKVLVYIAPGLSSRIVFVEDRLQDFDAVIATGSNNTARYFEYYFKDVPNIIRKNRNSVAVLSGEETAEDFLGLGRDIFTYYGLGCRNVSKLFVPVGYDFDQFYQGIYPFQDIIKYEKYANNYDYNKAVFLMSDYRILDNGFLTVREELSFASPISSVFFEYYEDVKEVEKRLKAAEDKIQCVVSNGLVANSLPFGKTQLPNLWDYADCVDTMKFLLAL